MESKKIDTSYGIINYFLQRKKVRHLNCRYNRDKNIIFVSCPINYKEEDVELFLKKHAKLITSWKQKAEKEKVKINPLNYINGDEFIFFGEKYYLLLNKVNKKQEEKAYIQGNNIFLNTLYLEDKKHNQLLVKKLYNNLTQRILKERYQVLRNKFSNQIPTSNTYKLKIRKMKTKWGTNNLQTRTITLNSSLVYASIEDIDYVIIHELCHCMVRKHNRLFYSYQEMYCPEWKKRKKDLNQNIYPYIIALYDIGEL